MAEGEKKQIHKELEQLVSASPVILQLFPESTEKIFKTFHGLLNYMINEVVTWEKFPKFTFAQNNKNRFTTAVNSFVLAMNATTEADRKRHFEAALAPLKKAATETDALIYSQTAAGKRLLSLCQKGYSDGYVSAFNYFVNTGRMDNLATRESVRGKFDAYHTLYPIDVSKEISEKEAALTRLAEAFQSDTEKLQKNYIDHWQEVDKNYQEYTAEMDSLKKKKMDELQAFLEAKESQLIILEDTYKEKIRLEAPVQYWKVTRRNNFISGIIMLVIAVLMGLLTAIYLLLSLSESILPDALKGDLSLFNANSIRSTLIITAGVSVMVYLLRLFVKMALSSFHLSKDAAERETLTYLFLSLTKDSKVSEAERAIVLQALFSRADTGLLKGDSSPSYSTETLTNIISKGFAGR